LCLETLSCDGKVCDKHDSQQCSSVSSNCNGESQPGASEPFYSLTKDVGQLNEVTAEQKMYTGTALYENFKG